MPHPYVKAEQPATALLHKLSETTNFQFGITKQEMRDIYDTHIRTDNIRVSYHFIFMYLLRAKVIDRMDKKHPDVVKFRITHVEKLLKKIKAVKASSNRMPSTSTSIPTRFRSHVPINIHPASNDASKQATDSKEVIKKLPYFVDQTRGFKVWEKVTHSRDIPQDTTCCYSCNKKFSSEYELQQHVKTDEHEYFKSQHSTEGRNKNDPFKTYGVFVESDERKEGIAALEVNISSQFLDSNNPQKLDVVLNVNYIPVKENSVSLILDRVFLVFGDPSTCLINYTEQQVLYKLAPAKCTLTLLGTSVGRSEYFVVFKIAILEGAHFFVSKRISCRVDTNATQEDGAPVFSTPVVYQQVDRTPSDLQCLNDPVGILEEGEPPAKPSGLLRKVLPLKEYEFPAAYRSFFNDGFKLKKLDPSILLQKLEVLTVLVNGLTESNYDKFLSLMLFLEEHQTICDLRSYSLKDIPLAKSKQNKKLITIKVPGLAENRPSVLKGDGIYITVPKTGLFKGWVHQLGQTTVDVKFGPKFMGLFVDNMKLNVDFSFNRHCFKLEHRALEMIKSKNQISEVCFPKTYGKFIKQKPRINWINGLVEKNPEQAQAVQNIITGTSLPSPYLVFGPPGTGKTITLVEAIKQIYYNSANDRVLATAPSNSAADLIAERLLESLPPSDVLRLYSPSRNVSTVPVKLKKCCNFFFQDREATFPSKEILMKKRIIVCTLICAGRLVSGGFPQGHFSHIFIDECGHGMETTCLVPVAGLLASGTKPGQLVLSGDPLQLGPVIRSPVAKSLGLAQSLLERLMTSCELYQKQADGKYNPQLLTKLVRNFRSHPDILKIPNELFYDGELQSCGIQDITYSACKWEHLPTKNLPLIFHGVEGKDEQDEGSPSFFNIAEVDLVVQYVQKIFNSKFCGQKLKPEDIGIISPYRRQISKIHRALERKKIQRLSVGSVEEFQGQERRVIIVSTVRSNPAQLALDLKFRLGFVSESKRFNVAITRAKSLLIVIGNPKILQHDPNWRCLLKFIKARGGYTGVPFELNSPDDPLQPLNLDELRVPVKEKLLKQLTLTKQALETESASDIDKLTQEMDNVTIVTDVSEVEAMVQVSFTSNQEQ